ncbi:unnamed protein product [Brachionus calyciflorus]|uniref:Uncharacterized protein n=1 Tax=Brachionus calyciflorus TaxID=104777 RepID=A0A813NDX5_9BILA|nr:unnamed protein product [Brachionus calyciflorus]
MVLQLKNSELQKTTQQCDLNQSTATLSFQDVSVRVARNEGPTTQAFVSMEDLADNEWLLERLNGYNYNDVVRFNASNNRECLATNRHLETSFDDLRQRFVNQSHENARLREENGRLKVQTTDGNSNEIEALKSILQMLQNEVNQLKKKIESARECLN